MIKKTLYFGNPACLSLAAKQLIIRQPSTRQHPDPSEEPANEVVRTIPIEDIAVVVLDHYKITITQALLAALLDSKVAVVTCNEKRLPAGLLLNLAANSVQNERFRRQIEASQPLLKQLWQQTVRAKIYNQASILAHQNKNAATALQRMAESVRSGDPDNLEAQAAAHYWKHIFPQLPDFKRQREGLPPNNLLNYGYAILRAVIARALTSSGLLPVYGIHHHNRYNDYCLADDIMEPYRPFVDKLVIDVMQRMDVEENLNLELKREMLNIPVIDVKIGNKHSPLMVAAAQTTASLAKCFAGEIRKITYPAA